MANPQKEHGNVGIANEIFDVLCRTRIPGEARQILDVIFRQTYGWQKKKDGIALATFVAKTGMNKAAVCRAIKTLSKMNLIIIEKDNAEWNIYEFNKDFATWKPLSKKITLSKKIMTIIEKDNLPLSKKIPSINNYSKNTITKKNIYTQNEEKNNKTFLDFWNEYPRKVSKDDAMKIWIKITDDEKNKAIEAAKRFNKSVIDIDPQYIPFPAKWLEKKRWEDEEVKGGVAPPEAQSDAEKLKKLFQMPL